MARALTCGLFPCLARAELMLILLSQLGVAVSPSFAMRVWREAVVELRGLIFGLCPCGRWLAVDSSRTHPGVLGEPALPAGFRGFTLRSWDRLSWARLFWAWKRQGSRRRASWNCAFRDGGEGSARFCAIWPVSDKPSDGGGAVSGGGGGECGLKAPGLAQCTTLARGFGALSGWADKTKHGG